MKTATKIIITILVLCSSVNLQAQWVELGGINSTPFATEGTSNPRRFTIDAVGNVYYTLDQSPPKTTGTSRVLKFDGNTWSELGGASGYLYPSASINDITTDNIGNVYTVGINNSKNYVAKFNGTSWSELGGVGSMPTLPSTITSIKVDAVGNVFVGGDFIDNGGTFNILQFGGGSWRKARGFSANVTAFHTPIFKTDFNHNIYGVGIAGLTTNPISGTCGVANWDGTNWRAILGSRSTNFNVSNNNGSAFAADESSNMYYAGHYTNTTGKFIVGKIVGDTAIELGGNNTSPFNGEVFNLTTDLAGNVYASGKDGSHTGGFSNTNGNAFVAKFNGSAWSELGGANTSTFSFIAQIETDLKGNIYALVQEGTRTFISKFATACPTSFSSQRTTICSSQLPFNWNGTNLNTSTTLTSRLTNAVGCDSFATIILKVNQSPFISPLTIASNTTICSSDPFNIINPNNNGIWSSSNTAVATVATGINNNGIVTVISNGSATMSYTITNASNCSSTASTIINVAVVNKPIMPTNASVCVGSSITMSASPIGGKWEIPGGSNSAKIDLVTGIATGLASGTAVVFYTVTNTAGCSSSQSTTLTINPLTTSTFRKTICQSLLPITINDSVFTNAGTKLTHRTNVFGCDSAITVILTVNQASSSSSTTFICNNQLPITINGTVFSKPFTQVTHLTNAAGCDSAATITLKLKDSVGLAAIAGASSVCVGSQIVLSDAISGGGWSSLNNKATVDAASGTVTGASTGSASIAYSKIINGCLNAVGKTITVKSLPAVPSINYGVGWANPQAGAGGGFNYCANRSFGVVGTPTGGVWSKTGVITVTTPAGLVKTTAATGAASLTYTFTDANGCSNSKTIVGSVVTCSARGVNGASEDKLVASGDFTMYPNPAHSFISLLVDKLIGTGTIVISDLYGKQVKMQALSLGTNTVDIANLAKGIYFVNIITNKEKTTKKLVVE